MRFLNLSKYLFCYPFDDVISHALSGTVGFARCFTILRTTLAPASIINAAVTMPMMHITISNGSGIISF